MKRYRLQKYGHVDGGLDIFSKRKFFTCDVDTCEHQMKDDRCADKRQNDRHHCGNHTSFHTIPMLQTEHLTFL